MVALDIRSFKEINKFYKTTIINPVLRKHRTYIFKRLNNKINLYRYKIGSNKVEFTGKYIDLCKQKTGFGYKSFFICPYCGEVRAKLYYSNEADELRCRSCINENIYKYRTNLYDEGGTDLIYYKMFKLAKSIGIDSKDLEFPFEPLKYIWNKPKYMRRDKYETVIRQLIILEQWRMNVIIFKTKYSTKYINELLENIATQSYEDMEYFPVNIIKEIEFSKAYRPLSILSEPMVVIEREKSI